MAILIDHRIKHIAARRAAIILLEYKRIYAYKIIEYQ